MTQNQKNFDADISASPLPTPKVESTLTQPKDTNEDRFNNLSEKLFSGSDLQSPLKQASDTALPKGMASADYAAGIPRRKGN